MKNWYVNFIVFIIFLSILSCREAWGDHALGNNFDLLAGDKLEDQIIVYCGNRDFISGCNSGIRAIPTYERQYDVNGEYAEYVEAATSNSSWILAKTIQVKNKKANYWIVSSNFNLDGINCADGNGTCDSIIQSHIIGPLPLNQFQEKVKEFKIDLKLE